MNLYKEDGASGEPMGITPNPAQAANPPTGNPVLYNGEVAGPTIYQIGNEGGFLPAVAVHHNSTPITLDMSTDPTGQTAIPDGPFNLMLAPAERADVIIDFGEASVGDSFILYNDAPAPFPGGDSRNDYFTGNQDQTSIGGAPSTVSGMGPNTRTLMRFNVVAAENGGDTMTTQAWLGVMNNLLLLNFMGGIINGVPAQQDPPLYTTLPPFGAFAPFSGTPDRILTLNEDFDEFGRLIQTLGTSAISGNNNQGIPTFGRGYEGGLPPGSMEPPVGGPSVSSGITETPTAGATEVWLIFNTTADTHPMHFHLVNLQVIQRQPYNTAGLPSTGSPGQSVDLTTLLTGSPMPPDANEAGWKEVVRMNPGEATWIIAQWKLPTLPAAIGAGNPTSPRTGGHEYVWHCHILEHEEHDMMRAITVRGTFPTT